MMCLYLHPSPLPLLPPRLSPAKAYTDPGPIPPDEPLPNGSGPWSHATPPTIRLDRTGTQNEYSSTQLCDVRTADCMRLGPRFFVVMLSTHTRDANPSLALARDDRYQRREQRQHEQSHSEYREYRDGPAARARPIHARGPRTSARQSPPALASSARRLPAAAAAQHPTLQPTTRLGEPCWYSTR